MPWCRSEIILSVVVRFVAVWSMIPGLTWFETSEAAQESLVNCNEVIFEDRCACNERVLLALTQMKRIVPDTTQFGNTGEANTAIIIQQEQQHRLRTFYAPACDLPSSPERLPLSEQHRGGWFDRGAIDRHLKSLRTETIELVGKDIGSNRLLIGRWEGWQTLFNGKPSPVSFYVFPVDGSQPFLKACSDQGMVFLRVKDGYLELPRFDPFGLAYSIRLWRSSAPHSQDLEGVALLDVRPGQVVVAGLVQLSRVVMFDWSTPPSSYFCQDRDLEEQKRMAREEQERNLEEKGKLLFIQLKKQIQQLGRELEAVRLELERTRSRSFVGDVNHQSRDMDAK